MASSVVFLILAVCFLLSSGQSRHVLPRELTSRAPPSSPGDLELSEIIGPSSYVNPGEEPTCDLARTGHLAYYDCLQTIWSMPNDRRGDSYSGQKVFFGPQGSKLECAIAIVPFPISEPNQDTTSWTWLRENAIRIAAKCQRGKLYGCGGYKIGLGFRKNTAVLVFRLSRPKDLPENYRASLSATNTGHAWTQLYDYLESVAFPSSAGATQPHDPNEPSSSTGQTSASLALSSHATLDNIALLVEWGEPPPDHYEIEQSEIVPAALEFFPGGDHDGTQNQAVGGAAVGGAAAVGASGATTGQGDIEEGGIAATGDGQGANKGYCFMDSDCGIGRQCLRIIGRILGEMLFGIMFCCEFVGTCGGHSGIGG